MVRVKVCGITNSKDAMIAVSYGADAIGFVFTRSPRQISTEKAAVISRALHPFVARVGVFADARLGDVKKTIKQCCLTAVQLHGNETPRYCQKITTVSVIKAFRVKDENSLAKIHDYDVDAVLLDSFVEGKLGGTGEPFNWVLIQKINKPLVLAGGLNINNVKKAIQKIRPYAVDVSTGVEYRPGKKDPRKLRQFIRMVKGESSWT
ncbi:MAG: phosphoribosylanthranilate isomerase [Candidatus Omnitrophota bacterium]